MPMSRHSAKAFNPPARRVIEELVNAIVEDRSSVSGGDPGPADQRLWSVLESVRLDPARSLTVDQRTAAGAGKRRAEAERLSACFTRRGQLTHRSDQASTRPDGST